MVEKCCCEQDCRCKEDKKDKKVKVYFCPKCKSREVGYIFALRSIFGLMPRMRCRKCGFESSVFPILVTSEKHLNKLDKKNKRKKR